MVTGAAGVVDGHCDGDTDADTDNDAVTDGDTGLGATLALALVERLGAPPRLRPRSVT